MNIQNYELSFLPEMKYLCSKSCAYQMLEFLGYKNPLQYIYVGCFPSICVFKEHFIANGKISKICGEHSFIVEGKGKLFNEIFSTNKVQLEKGINPIVIVDTYYLPYRTEYQKLHGAHAVILTGYNDNYVEIIDWYAPTFFKGNLLIQDFIMARTSNCDDFSNPFACVPITNTWYYIDVSKLDEEIRKKIIFENLGVLTCQVESKNNTFEKAGKGCLDYLQSVIRKSAISNETNKSVMMKKIHDALFPFLCTSKLMVVYLNNLDLDYDFSILKGLIYQVIDLLDKINYTSMRCHLSYSEKFYQKTQEYLAILITRYENLQVEANKVYEVLI